MTLIEFKEGLINAIKQSRKGSWQHFVRRKENREHIEYIKSLYPNLSNRNEILYLWLNDLKEPKLCVVCNKKYATFKNINIGYGNQHCSCSCAQLDPNTNNSFRNNNCMKNPEFRKKREDDYEKKHGEGIRNPFQLEENKVKAKNTKKERYGDENYNNREQATETCLERYGATTYIQSEEGRKTSEQTCLEKYNETHHWKNKEIHQKCFDTIIKNNGALGMASEKIKSKVIATNKEKTGYEHNWSDPECRNKCYKKCEELYGIKHPVLLHPPDSVSKGELEVKEFIQSIYSGIIEGSNRTELNGWELDIWLPELKKAIEYDGTYWHSSKQAEIRDTYKNKLCIEHEIDLFRVAEDDWLNDKERIKRELKLWINNN